MLNFKIVYFIFLLSNLSNIAVKPITKNGVTSTIRLIPNAEPPILSTLFIILTTLYTKYIKKMILIDVFFIGINFIIRAVMGIILLEAVISPWIIMGVFFVALLLGFMKRKGELESLGDQASEHRSILQEYNIENLRVLIIISAILVITTYSIYAITGTHNDGRLVFTVPIMAFIIFRQIYLSTINYPSVESNNIFKDKTSIIAIIIFSILTFFLIYSIPDSILM